MPQRNNQIEPMEQQPSGGKGKAIAIIGAGALAVTLAFVGYLAGLYEPSAIISLAR